MARLSSTVFAALLVGCSSSQNPTADLDAPGTAADAPADAAAAPDGSPSPRDAPPADAPLADAPLADAPPSDAPPLDAPTPDAPPPASLNMTKDASGGAQGTVSSSPAGLACGPACASASASFPYATSVTLEAKAQAGSMFLGWSGACTGLHRFCTVALDADATVTARFGPITHNLVFVTSEKYAGDMGGLDGADTNCQRLAAKAGLDGTFVAFLSTDTVNAIDRLVVPGGTTSARGFVRMDGLPLFDEPEDVAARRTLFYPVLFDEDGAEVSDLGDAAWTGSEDGTAFSGQTCTGWTTSDPMALAARRGAPEGGASYWLDSGVELCSEARRIYCAMVDDSTALVPDATPGKLIYVTKAAFIPGGGIAAADQACADENPGKNTVSALLATDGHTAAERLEMSASYVRPDGILVGTGADLVAASRGEKELASGIWQSGDGTYIGENYVWTGAGAMDEPGTDASTCSDWASTSGDAINGESSTVIEFWNDGGRSCTTAYASLYCVEP